MDTDGSVLRRFCAIAAHDLETQLSALWTQLDHACSRAPLVGSSSAPLLVHLRALEALLEQLEDLDPNDPAEELLVTLTVISRDTTTAVDSADLALRGVRQRGYGQPYQFPPFGMFFGLGQARPLSSLRELARAIHRVTVGSVRAATGLPETREGSDVSVTFQHGMSHARRMGSQPGLQGFVVLPVWIPFSARYFPLVAHEVVHPIVDELIDHAEDRELRRACDQLAAATKEIVGRFDPTHPVGRAVSDGLAKEVLADAFSVALYQSAYTLSLFSKTLRFGDLHCRRQRQLFPYLSRLYLHEALLKQCNPHYDPPLLHAKRTVEEITALVEGDVAVAERDDVGEMAKYRDLTGSCVEFLREPVIERMVRTLQDRASHLPYMEPETPSNASERWLKAFEHAVPANGPRCPPVEFAEPFHRDNTNTEVFGEDIIEVLWHSALPVGDRTVDEGTLDPGTTLTGSFASGQAWSLSVGGLFHGVVLRTVQGVIPTDSGERARRSLRAVTAHVDRRYWYVNATRLDELLSKAALVVCREVQTGGGRGDTEEPSPLVARSLGWSTSVELTGVGTMTDLSHALASLRGDAGDRMTQLLYDDERLERSRQPLRVVPEGAIEGGFNLRAFVRYKGGNSVESLIAQAAVDRVRRSASTGKDPDAHADEHVSFEHVTGHDDMEIRWELRHWNDLVDALLSVRDLQRLVHSATCDAVGASRNWLEPEFIGVLAVDCRIGWTRPRQQASTRPFVELS